jgi:hypothetical protein
MRLSTSIRPARNIEDVPVDPALAEHEKAVREARLDLARRQSAWVEIPETRLVRRGRYLVDAETDLVYTLRRGVVFETGNATVGYVVPGTPMTYTVNEADEVVFLEQPSSHTWSEVVARRARRT